MTRSAYSPAPPTIAQLAASYAAEVARKRRRFLVFATGVALAVLAAGWLAEVDLGLFFSNIHKFPNYIGRIFILDSGPYAGSFVLFDIPGWFWGLGKWLRLLADTLLIAYVATVLGALFGFLLCFLAAGNLGVSAPVRFGVRRILEFCRTVPELVFALVFVIAFGLGPIAGVLAIIVHTTGALGKLFYEVLENIDQKPVEGLIASGASWTKTMRFAVLPQVLSNFVSYALLRFEINVRGASVMGFVGAGGIGQDLMEAIRKFYYPDVSAILVLIIITVALIDLITERVRRRFIAETH
ncbi:MAG: phosphonate ABC transporter, permease protein PhnE [Aestuariivirga sp.]|uniref:phosphonate ABC transporter, permease protein PhnE n=1 Tax=Aestuariivirga sp. TaxID=2650926 RepID=UPI0025BEFF73|nr:phosphonate ABC transporter, permease protein PhnE [Aestuariivirga sp.]MCA3560319.1 phosphonate ABC transporter, permease protein PhnE [Aestuariivirga sp.]